MFRFEFDPIYDIFEGGSVLAMLAARCAEEKQARTELLMEAVRLFYAGQTRQVTSGSLTAAASMTERNLAAALRRLTQIGILRRTGYRPAVFRLQDPVAMDEGGLLRYNPFAQRIADEFRDYRDPLPYEVQLAYAWRTYPGLPEEVILEVIHQTLEKDATAGMKAAEPLLPIVKEAETREEVVAALAEHVQRYNECKTVLIRLGQDREPTGRELEMYLGWVREWGFTPDAVLEACAAAGRGNPTFDYLNGVLRNIYQQAHPAAQLDAGAVSASFRITEEFREICGLAGSGSAPAKLEEYRALREQYDRELIRLAAKESGRAGAGFDGILKRLVSWEEQGLRGPEEVQAYLEDAQAQYDLMAELFAQWGMEDSPTPRDCRLARQWLYAGFSREMIFAAAEYAFAAEDPPLYTAKVLRRFQEKGIRTPRQAELDHQEHLRQVRFARGGNGGAKP